MSLAAMMTVYSMAGAFAGMVPFVLLTYGASSGLLAETPALPAVVVGSFVGGPILGFLGGARYETRRWLSAGDDVGLAPADGDTGSKLVGFPPLTGLVDGRRVRVERRTKSVDGSGPGSNDATASYTYIETRVDPPAQEGVQVHRLGPGAEFDDTGAGLEAIERSEDVRIVRDRELAAISANDIYAQAVTTGRARRAILRADGVEKIRIGDLSGAFEAVGQELVAQADASEPFGLSLPEIYQGLGEADPTTATATVDRVLFHDGSKLERRVTAVVAAADAFEDARSRRDSFT